MAGSNYSGERNVHEIWHRIFQHLPGAFWSNKGISGQCPFCHADSTSGKQVFLIMFEGDEFRKYLCFKCGEHGSGFRGISKLARNLGVRIKTLDAVDMLSETGTFNRTVSDEVRPIAWPPEWVEETNEITKKAIDYMKNRGIKDPEAVASKYELIFSESVEMVYKDQAYVNPYPCILAPFTGEEGVIGWTSRLIDNTKTDAPKSIAASGRQWRSVSLFGYEQLDPRKPVTIVEGIFDAIATPNSVAAGGKYLSEGQISLLAETGARVFIFGFDPEVEKKSFANFQYSLHLEAPGCSVLAINWKEFCEDFEDLKKDPGDRGPEEMAKIIRQTVMDNLK